MFCLTEHSCRTQTKRISSQGGQPVWPPSPGVPPEPAWPSPLLSPLSLHSHLPLVSPLSLCGHLPLVSHLSLFGHLPLVSYLSLHGHLPLVSPLSLHGRLLSSWPEPLVAKCRRSMMWRPMAAAQGQEMDTGGGHLQLAEWGRPPFVCVFVFHAGDPGRCLLAAGVCRRHGEARAASFPQSCGPPTLGSADQLSSVEGQSSSRSGQFQAGGSRKELASPGEGARRAWERALQVFFFFSYFFILQHWGEWRTQGALPEPHLQPHIFYFESGSHYVAQAGLELEVLLPQPPSQWDYGREPLPLLPEFLRRSWATGLLTCARHSSVELTLSSKPETAGNQACGDRCPGQTGPGGVGPDPTTRPWELPREAGWDLGPEAHQIDWLENEH